MNVKEIIERFSEVYGSALRGDAFSAEDPFFWYSLLIAVLMGLTVGRIYYQSVKTGKRNWFFAYLTFNFVYICGCLIKGHPLAITLSMFVFAGIECFARRSREEIGHVECDSENSRQL